mmetsp:Transcript_2512/g.5218  ORF Transcript_2512/g.5218 Transcript_2512/m.5218 type:complete len:123 (+) Transcript_2512:60-428(+)
MDGLSKEQKDEYATVFAMLALYDGGADITSDQINSLLQATGNTEVEGFYPVIMANYAGDPDKLAGLIAVPGAGSGGGGGGGAGGGGETAEEEKEEEKEEEVEEEPVGGGMGDMFGGEEGGDY